MSLEEHEIKEELKAAKVTAHREDDGGIAVQTSSKTLPKYDTSEKSIAV